MTNNDADLVYRIASEESLETVDQLQLKYIQVWQQEVRNLLGDLVPDVAVGQNESLFAEVMATIFDNAKDYREAHGAVKEWICACARLATCYWLRKSQRWPKARDPEPLLTCSFRISYKSYSDELLKQAVLLCPLKTRPVRGFVFWESQDTKALACNQVCSLLHGEREGKSKADLARTLCIPPSSIPNYLKQCHDRARSLFFDINE
jgi:hypothetical protein